MNLYRYLKICSALEQHTLNVGLQYGQITPQLALKVLIHFDRTMNQALAHKVKNRLTFKVRNILNLTCSVICCFQHDTFRLHIMFDVIGYV